MVGINLLQKHYWDRLFNLMALRNQPYIPLYIQDIMTDEKLNECSAATHGVYIKGIMCLMHKSEEYGKLLLKQKYKQNKNICFNFATMLASHLPYTFDTILAALEELLEEKVCHIEGDYLVQKRMVRDNEISVTRSKSGKKGGIATQEKKQPLVEYFAKAKSEANSEYEYEDIDYNTLTKYYKSPIIKFLIEDLKDKPEITSIDEIKNLEMVVVEMNKIWKKLKPDYTFDEQSDYSALLRICYLIAEKKQIRKYDAVHLKQGDIIESFSKIAAYIANTDNKFFRKLTLSGICIRKNFQSIEEEMRVNQLPNKQEKLESKRVHQEDYFENQ